MKQLIAVALMLLCLTGTTEAQLTGGSLTGGFCNEIPDTAVRPLDWTNSFDHVWNFEDSPGLTADSGSVGQSLTNNGSIVGVAETSVQGSKAAEMAGDGTQWFSIADGTNIDRSGYGQTLSFGCWTYWDTDSTSANEYIITKGEPAAAEGGYGVYNRGVVSLRIQWRNYLMAGPISASSGQCSNCCDTGTGDCASRPTYFANQIAECAANADCYSSDLSVWMWVAGDTKSSTDGSTSNAYSRVRYNGNSVGTATQIFSLIDNAIDLTIGMDVAANDLDGKVDECFWDDTILTDAEACRICSLGIAGQRGECDPATQANYKICNTNADCVDNLCVMEQNTTDEDNCASSAGGTQGCCMGYNWWPRLGLNCNDCDLPACNATRS